MSRESRRDERLWTLTLEALPMFTNLKQLAFVPRSGTTDTAEASRALSRCTFQLTHLWWDCQVDQQVSQFLRSHGSHLEYFDMSVNKSVDVHSLPSSILPVLSSASCGYSAAPFVMSHRGLVALRLSDYGRSAFPHLDVDPSTAGSVRYLFLDIYSPIQPFSKVVILELLVWSMEVRYS